LGFRDSVSEITVWDSARFTVEGVGLKVVGLGV
jgi:hypothetical protein